eukprot:m.54905 g.54905  ORF g.54905 m.54905 type:complete len:162 (+) comp12908_c0_seq1:123-608(+)
MSDDEVMDEMDRTLGDEENEEDYADEVDDDVDYAEDKYKEAVSPIPRLTELKLTGIESNRTHSKDAMRRIQRENIMLLTKLDQIQRKGGALETKAPVRKHVAAATVNRRKQQRETTIENKAFLKRLEKTKSTVPKPSKAKPGPPRQKKSEGSRLVQPEWKD